MLGYKRCHSQPGIIMKQSSEHDYFLPKKNRLLIGVLVFIWIQSIADVLAHETPPSEINIEDRSWVLFSSGVRDYFFMDLYECAVYLDGKEKNLDSILNLIYPVAIRLKILTSELPGQVPDPWKETIKPEVSDKIYSRFKKQFFKLSEGDIILFIYFPGESTVFYLNGERKFMDPGPGLMEALLEQWLGPSPVSEELKASLING